MAITECASYVDDIKMAARAFRRIYDPIAEAREAAAEADAGFDGGEWSCSFHAAESSFEFHSRLKMVADRFRVKTQHLYGYLVGLELPFTV